jgi:hypothetical protein
VPGILRLPSGRLIRGRGLARPLPAGPSPTFAVYLLGQPPPAVPWVSRWLRWPDFRLPADRAEVLPVLTEAWQRAAGERVEIACTGGHGRTGTALACLAILDGVPRASAVAFVRAHYDKHAVETFWQRRYVARWHGPADEWERGRQRQEYTGGDLQRQQEIASEIFAALRTAGRYRAVYIDDMQKILDSYNPGE